MRHLPGERNRKKIGHHASCGDDELKALRADLAELAAQVEKVHDRWRYLFGRFYRIENRLKSERKNETAHH